MRKIKTFKSFEAISGQEMIGSMGPNYGDTKIPTSLTKNDTTVVFSTLDNKFYTFDEYSDAYQDYLKKNGPPLDGFNERNLDLVIDYLQGKNESESYKEIIVGDPEFSKYIEKERKSVDFTQDEVDKIREIFPEKQRREWGAEGEGRLGIYSIHFTTTNLRYQIDIEKFDDEWYHVTSKYPRFDRVIDIDMGRHMKGKIHKNHFSCDQFDGLLECLSYLKKEMAK